MIRPKSRKAVAVVFAAALAVAGLLVIRDTTSPRDVPGAAGESPSTAAGAPVTRMPAEPASEVPWSASRCRAEIARLSELPALPGAPILDEQRAALLLQYKAEPVLFLRPPEIEASEDKVVRAHRARLARSRYPADTLERYLATFSHRPDLGRQVLLREGYVWADSPALMRGILAHLRAEHLFSSPELWIQRGSETAHAVLDARTGRYTYDSGPSQGHRVRVLPFDRLASSLDGLRAPIHRELRRLRNRLGFDRMQVERITAEGIVATLRYGEVPVAAVLGGEGPELQAICEAVEPDARASVDQARGEAIRRLRLVKALRDVALAQVREGLPFDEPRTEYGQQDGRLRPAWESAYAFGQRTFRFQGDRYPVFGAEGQPLVPQVCLDFLLDTLDRAGGGWWQPAGQPLRRVAGRFDRDGLKLANPRSIDQFVESAGRRTSQMELLTIAPADRIEFRKEQAFLQFLSARVDDFVPGDIVIIRGYLPKPRDRRYDLLHYHSVFVYETDPITGAPILLVGNSGVPRLTTWRHEMLRSPRRSIYHRIRLRTDWLESFVVAPNGDAVDPPPVVAASPSGLQ